MIFSIVNQLVYYGLSYTAAELAGNAYVNVCLSGLVEVPGVVASIWLFNYVGRIPSVVVSGILNGIVLLCTLAVQKGRKLTSYLV